MFTIFGVSIVLCFINSCYLYEIQNLINNSWGKQTQRQDNNRSITFLFFIIPFLSINVIYIFNIFKGGSWHPKNKQKSKRQGAK
jgi:hypothetical protein